METKQNHKNVSQSFLPGEPRYHATVVEDGEEEDLDLCEAHYNAMSEEEKHKHTFVVVYKGSASE